MKNEERILSAILNKIGGLNLTETVNLADEEKALLKSLEIDKLEDFQKLAVKNLKPKFSANHK